MIRYSLRCERGHAFESWFQSSSAYESQEKRKLVSCPACGSVKVEHAIMAPQIVSKKGRDKAPVPPRPRMRLRQRLRKDRDKHRHKDVGTQGSTPLLMAQERELRAKLKELRDHIVKNADNVGEQIPQRSAQDALRRYRASPDLWRGLARRGPR